MVAYRKCFCHLVSLLNNNTNVNWISKCGSIRVMCLPRAFVQAIGKRRGEKDLDCCLCPCAGGIKGNLIPGVEDRSANVPQAITSIPVARATVFDQPLLIYRRAKCDERIIGNCEIVYECKIVRTLFGIQGWKNGWQGSGLNYDNFFCGVDNQCRLDKRSL